MEEILKKLNELNELCQTIPNDCKGNDHESQRNRHKYMIVKAGIREIMSRLNEEKL